MSPPTSPALQRLHRLDRSSSDFHDQLHNVLRGEEYVQCEENLEGDDLVWLIDYLDKALAGLDPSSPASRKCLRELRNICGTRVLLPTSYSLPLHPLQIDTQPFTPGGSCDVYRGTLRGSKICVKRIRTYAEDVSQKAAKTFCKEAVVWKRLTHPNVLPLLGITVTPPQLISNWVSGGNLLGYVQKNPDADQLRLLSGVAEGLCYLHSCNVIHGDLKGPNILVGDSGHVWIADFGLSKITKNPNSIRSASCQNGYTMQWAAPEVLIEGECSKKADIFSLAMVMIEIFTREVPFNDLSPPMAMLAITQGKRPSRPAHPTFTEHLWMLMQNCWDHDSHLRPEAPEVLQALRALDLPAWKRLINYPLSTDERIALMTSIFSDRNETDVAGHLPGSHAQTFVDMIDQALDSLSPEIRRRCLLYLSGICDRQNLLPKSLSIPLCCDLKETPQDASENVRKGRYNGQEVAAKVLRVPTSGLEQTRKRFYKVVVIWKSLHHPNILPLLGITMTEHRFVVVSEWMENGNISEFVRVHPDANRLELLADVTKGLIYMHNQGIVHGDIKGSNILINKTGRAVLAGFGLLTIIPDELIVTSSDSPGGTTRWVDSVWWSAPEVLKGGASGKETDIYSLAMVVIEVFTGTTPFGDVQPIVAMLAITQGRHPPRPTHPDVTGRLWNLIKRCWHEDPYSRPEASEVLRTLFDSNPPTWRRLISPTLPTNERMQLIMTTFSDCDEVEVFKYLSGNDAQAFVDVMDEALYSWDSLYLRSLDGLRSSGSAFQKCLHELRNICGIKAILPISYNLSSDLLRISSNQIASDYYDAYEGTYDDSNVCIKRVRMYSQDSPRTTVKTFYQEAVLWKHLKHPNILPLLGVTTNPLQLISDWVPGGTLPEFIKNNPDADRVRLLSDVASGLHYLHSGDMIHGDLRGSNVVVDADGNARITNFRLVTVSSGVCSGQTASNKRVGSYEWSAPEVLKGRTTSKEADIFSFAMVMIEVFTGTTPFGDVQSIMAMLAITQGRRPLRPTHLGVTGRLWNLMQRCWDDDPYLRPGISEVLLTLFDSNPPPWKRLIGPTLPVNERIQLITSIFSDRDEVEVFKHLSRYDAQAFVDVIDEVLESMDDLPPEIRRRCLRCSYRMCGREALLPKSLQIPLCYDPAENPRRVDVLVDVWKGEYKGQEVAAKAFRVYMMNDLERIGKRFCKEVMTWKTPRHPNVLPLIGVTMTENPRRFVMVSRWMKNGNIIEFLQRENAGRLKLLADATKGLIYMHDQGIVHGDLKGLNIMINETGCAVLADFGLVTFIPDQSTFLSACIDDGSVRWMSPELLDPEGYGLQKALPTRESDCYALGMVVYEILSGCSPYATNNSFVVLRKVLDGERPERPQGEEGRLFTDGIWDVIELCWKPQPSERARARNVLLFLEGDFSTTDRDDDWSDATSNDTQYFSDELGTVESDSGSLIAPDESGPLVPPLDSPPGVRPGPVIPQDGGRPPNPPQDANPEGRIGDWLVLILWHVFNAVIGRIHIV